jgi:TetR/AcrR family transcriptional regulator, copper-responsive repressor
MVQNVGKAPRRVGRPRAYDPEAALRRAMDRFWKSGYAGTSLDDISAETGMNRPSLYAAFGDKRTLYLKALEAYWRVSHGVMRDALADEALGLEAALMHAYDAQLRLYVSDDGLARGCFVVGTAVTEALEDVEIRASLAEGYRGFDTAFEARLRVAQEKGELTKGVDPAGLAVLASAVLHSLAVRARTGAPCAALRDIARQAVSTICGHPQG